MSDSSAVAQPDMVLSAYRSRMLDLHAQIDRLRTRKLQALAFTAGSFLIFAVFLAMALHGSGLGIAVSVFFFACGVWASSFFLRCRRTAIELAQRLAFNERATERIESDWRGKGRTGIEFARASHLYQKDLDILGVGSLFELLATTRSEVGAERLAAFLLDRPTVEVAKARQESVQELRADSRMREDIALLGRYSFQNCEGKHVRAWLSLPALTVPTILPVFLVFSGTVSLALGLCGYAKILSWAQVLPILIPWLAAQAWIGLALMRRVRIHLKALVALCGDVVVLRQGAELMERQKFASARLRGLVERLRGQRAAAQIRKLERMVMAVEHRDDLILYGFSLWLALGTQLVLATERWRAAHRKGFEDWLDAWAEFDAVSALACYAYEHPENSFPELIESHARFEAKGLRHPLMPRATCVANDVELNQATAFYVISGSNMAGKSTFLRALGLNAVLAAAGAPVCAAEARICLFTLCASIGVSDALTEGRSKFLAEVERLSAAIDAVHSREPVLFLIDEMLSGTNSRDRRVVAEWVVAALVKRGAVGALSTHDLALTEIAEKPGMRGMNVHMQSEKPEEPLCFDYCVKPGVLRQTNALAIVKMLGIRIRYEDGVDAV